MPVTAVARNARGKLLIYEQSDVQTPATGASPAMQAHLVSSSISARQPLYESEEITSSRNPAEGFLEAVEVGDGFEVEMDPVSAGFYLKWILGVPTTTGAGPFTHVFKPSATALTALTIERVFSDIAQVFRADGCKLNRFSFDVSRGGVLKMPIDVIGLGETGATTQLDATPFFPAKNVFRTPVVTLMEGGVTFPLCSRFNLSFENGMEGLPVLGNNGKFYDIIEGIARPTGTLSIWLADRALYDKAAAGTESSLKITFTSVTGAHTLEFLLPEVKYELSSPRLQGGNGAVGFDLAFRAHYTDNADAAAIKATLINSQASYTAIPAT